ncbi:hypothetical protein ASC82_10735 [Streptomyces sp. Root431]|uniref:hypothetical protein n=1 Tax=Streptomyces sp. Root431 TaxID=1736535 RepID=UPI0006FA3BB2|nr:hypothetical protein [Streptomyces sp. Root431]KQX13072.1 hypothetical protein ASC82_10735 [Streptomyces sp. Root431]
MSASDQDTPAAEAPEAPEAPEIDETSAKTSDEGAGEPDETEESEESEEFDESAESDEFEEESSAGGLTPKQARRLRVAAASVLLVALAVVLVIRLASRTSVLVVGVYGLAMILCGVVIELSRNGRTRLATWLLVSGLLSALAFDWLILP